MVVQARANQDMKSHLLKCKYNKNNKIATGEEFFDLCKLRSLDSKKVQVELVEAILSCGCSINILSNPKFRAFLVNNIPKFKIPSVHSVRNVIIPELAHGVRAIIGKKLLESSLITLTLDGWTKRGSQGLYALVATTDNGEELPVEVFETTSDSVTGEWLQSLVTPTIKEFGNRIVCFTTDCGSNVKWMRERIHENDAEIASISCIIHLMNNMCKNIFKADCFKDVIKDVKHVVKTISSSNKITYSLKANGGTSLKRLVDTRFSYILHSIKSILDNRKALLVMTGEKYLLDFTSISIIQNNEFWNKLEVIVRTLGKIGDKLAQMECSSFTLADAFVHLTDLFFSVVEVHTSNDEFFIDCLQEFAMQFKNIFHWMAQPVVLFSIFTDVRYNVEFSYSTVKIIELYIISIATKKGAEDGEIAELLKEFNAFSQNRSLYAFNIPSAKTFWIHNYAAKQYPSLGYFAVKSTARIAHAMGPERFFSRLGWLNSPRRARQSVISLVDIALVNSYFRSVNFSSDDDLYMPEIEERSILQNEADEENLEEFSGQSMPCSDSSFDHGLPLVSEYSPLLFFKDACSVAKLKEFPEKTLERLAPPGSRSRFNIGLFIS